VWLLAKVSKVRAETCGKKPEPLASQNPGGEEVMIIRPVNDVRKLVYFLRTRGLSQTVRQLPVTIESRLGRWFDHRHGTDTSEYVMLSSLGYGTEEQQRSSDYRATPVRTLRTLLSRLPHDLSSFTFIDFGSGKGRALFVASDFAFRQIVGVEFSEALHRIAEKNLRVYRGRKQRCFTLLAVHTRAEEFALPAGPLVLYFYNPFEQEIMARVLRGVVAAWTQSPRTIYLVFIRVRFRSLVEQLDIFQELPLGRLPFDLARPPGYAAAVFVSQ
jgi:SAM-dependent methyltransferase